MSKPKKDWQAEEKKRQRNARIEKGRLIHAKKGDELPPHSIPAEQGALGCVLLAAGANGTGELPLASMAQVDSMLIQLRPKFFYDTRHALIFDAMRMMRLENHAVDLVTLQQWLKDKKQLEPIGGINYLASLPDAATSQFHLPNYLAILQEKALRRHALAKGAELMGLHSAESISIEDIQGRLSELFDATERVTNKPLIEVVSPKEARAFVPDPADALIGQGLISQGTFFTIGGEPGGGKSRLLTTLAVAGARGNGQWQGYPVNCQWRTLILQTENSGMRLKEEFDAVPVAADEFIRVSNSLPNGMAFNSPDFRRELQRYHQKWPFQMLGIDPWNDASAEEGQGDYAECLRNIQACFRGAKMPAVGIVAHLRKARADANGRRKTGRELLHELSGSLKLGSTSRTVFTVTPVSPDMTDTRIVFECAKANDANPDWLKKYSARSAWHRANGAFSPCAEFDWDGWMNPTANNSERRAVSLEMIQAVFVESKRPGMKSGQLVAALSEKFEIGKSTAWRAIGDGGYATKWLDEVAGIVALKEEFKP